MTSKSKTAVNLRSASRRSLDLNLNVMCAFGWWPPDGYRDDEKKMEYYRYYQVFAVGLFYGTYMATEVVNMFAVWGDIEKVVEASFLLLTHLAQVVKAFVVLGWSARIKRLLDRFEEPLFDQRLREHDHIIDKYTFIVKRDSRVFLLMAATTILLWTIFPFIEKDDNDPDGGGLRLPLKAWYPFETDSSPMFEVIYTYQMVAVFISAYTNICTDTLTSGVMVLTSLQLDVLHHNLATIDRDRPSILHKKKKLTSHCERLKECIEHHQAIITFVTDQNDVFSYIFLGQFFVAVIVICITAFQLTLVPVSIQFFSMILYLACMLMEIFLYCYHGNEIIIRSTELPRAFIHCKWYEQKRDFAQLAIILMERSKRPLRVTAGKIFVLSLPTFVAIVRSSYSYFAVLQQMHNK